MLSLKLKGVGIILHIFCSRDRDLDLMTSIYKPDPYAPKMYRMSKNILCTSRLSKDRQTDMTKIITTAALRVANVY